LTVDHHTIAAISLTGTALNLLGGLYLAYDLFGGQHGPLRTLTRAATYGVLFFLGYVVFLPVRFSALAALGTGSTLAVEFARAARGAVKGTAIAGKTGTSRDGWFVGYTPNLVCAVWIGFDDNQQLGLTGAEAALPAWTEFMKGAVELRPALGGRNFLCPEGIRFVETDADNGLISTLSCPNRELIAITDALAPNVECYAHGNLPNSLQAEQPQVEAGDSVRKQQPKGPSNRDAPEPLIIAGTRVDIDQRGRRTLVNAMR